MNIRHHSDISEKKPSERMVGTIAAAVIAIVVAAELYFNLNAAGAAVPSAVESMPSYGPVEIPEMSYKPGIASQIEYDYIRVDGQRYVVFRDKYTGSISVQKFF